MKFRPLPIMTAFALVSLVILCILGNWQWTRYQEKVSVIATETVWQTLIAERIEDQPFYLSTIMNGRAAWREVLVYEDQGRAILAVTGIEFAIEPPVTPLAEPSTSARTLGRGIFRTPARPGLITPPADMATRTLYAFDFEALEAELGQPVSREVFEPEILVARDETGTGAVPNPQANPELADPLPPARHLGYALTWWGMALALIVIYLVYHAGVGRLKFGGQDA